jgi:nucleoid-associated protein YgaU
VEIRLPCNGYRTWIAQAHEPVAGEAPVPRDRTAAVEPGDTLWGIAEEYYSGEHTGWVVMLIREANPGIGDVIHPGDVVRLPEVE